MLLSKLLQPWLYSQKINLVCVCFGDRVLFLLTPSLAHPTHLPAIISLPHPFCTTASHQCISLQYILDHSLPEVCFRHCRSYTSRQFFGSDFSFHVPVLLLLLTCLSASQVHHSSPCLHTIPASHGSLFILSMLMPSNQLMAS